MRLHEYEAAALFERYGIPVPARDLASSPEEARKIAERLGGPVVLKAQVLVGGRGLAGGVRVARNPKEAYDLAKDMLGSEIKGSRVGNVLVAQRVSLEKELYFGIAVDGYEGKPVVLVSTEGGMNIEEAARRFPEKIARLHIEAGQELFPYEARGLFKQLDVSSRDIVSLSDVLIRLYNVFVKCNALIAEINPLTMVTGGGLMAVDAVLEIDDSALFRLGDLVLADSERIENPLEREGRQMGITYVDMDGDIGIISSGAGLGMATMDIIAQRLRPANFLETGGGMTEDLLYRIMGLVMKKQGLRALFINIYGGINPIHLGAKGIVRYLREHEVLIPVVAKALGNRQEETWEILQSGGVQVVKEAATEKAVERLIELLEKRG